MQNQGQSGSQQTASQGKGMSSFDSLGPTKLDQVIREGYIQQAAIQTSDQQAVRQGQWDDRIPGFELTKHVLQNASDLVNKVGQTS